MSALVAAAPPFQQEEPLPTLRFGDLALTSTRPADGTGGRTMRPGGAYRASRVFLVTFRCLSAPQGYRSRYGFATVSGVSLTMR
jgi:hypothetical protein